MMELNFIYTLLLLVAAARAAPYRTVPDRTTCIRTYQKMAALQASQNGKQEDDLFWQQNTQQDNFHQTQQQITENLLICEQYYGKISNQFQEGQQNHRRGDIIQETQALYSLNNEAQQTHEQRFTDDDQDEQHYQQTSQQSYLPRLEQQRFTDEDQQLEQVPQTGNLQQLEQTQQTSQQEYLPQTEQQSQQQRFTHDDQHLQLVQQSDDLDQLQQFHQISQQDYISRLEQQSQQQRSSDGDQHGHYVSQVDDVQQLQQLNNLQKLQEEEGLQHQGFTNNLQQDHQQHAKDDLPQGHKRSQQHSRIQQQSVQRDSYVHEFNQHQQVNGRLLEFKTTHQSEENSDSKLGSGRASEISETESDPVADPVTEAPSFWEKLSNKAGSVYTSVKEKGKEALNSVKETAKSAYEKVKETFN